jgi:prepilin-type processing-associated H-X9-DG protein
VESIYDGASNTLMLSENLQADRWNVFPTSIPATINDTVALQQSQFAEPKLTFLWLPVESQQLNTSTGEPNNVAYKTNGGKFDTPSNPILYARPAAIHTGGVNVAFCDARITFLKEEIAYRVYAQLMTANGVKSQVGPAINYNYTLNSSDYEQ